MLCKLPLEAGMGSRRGRPYQQLVAEMAQAFDPGARISEGEWVPGPDGRLDLDVAIRGVIEGREALVVVECKDFNLATTGKVGRAFVDALDSKRHDLGADFAFICSNSGFTGDALRKAQRKGIGMISVLRAGDERVSAIIEKTVYLRKVSFGVWRFAYSDTNGGLKALQPLALHDLKIAGRSLDRWLQHRAVLIAFANPSVTAPLRASFRFTSPLLCDCRGNEVTLARSEVGFVYKTQWLAQTVRLDAARGIYDYLRRRMRLAPGDNTYTVAGVNWETAVQCEPPGVDDGSMQGFAPGEVELFLTMFEGLAIDESPELAELEPFVKPEDLTTSLSDSTA